MKPLAIAAVLLALAGVSSARAGDASADASQRYQRGMKHYNLGEWWAALDDFKQAYLVKADAALLFDIAQCQRQLGQYDTAARSYRAFLREAPDLSDEQRAEVRLLITQMEQASREQRAATPPTGTAPPEREKSVARTASISELPAQRDTIAERPPRVVATPELTLSRSTSTATPARAPLYKRWWLWTSVAAVVVVGVGVGIGVGATRPDAPARTAMTDFGTIKF